ncbi:hypothetical protein Q1695_013342 [Nippostrongylus brasiliensis]|nr:hypothetical protein Q1695_013342 [Nippostrongylus brasiliensis]
MDSWYKRGYFTEGLEVRRHTDTKYRTLGELMQLNGRMTPFDYKDDVAPPPPPVAAVFSNPAQSFATLFASGGMWSELGAQANMMYSQAGYDPIAAERKRIEDEQRRILEEQAKMREYQEHLVRELQKQREEQEKQLMEQKLALIKHQEEIERRERELKESAEETKARLEMERLALAEKARQIEEERIAKIEEEVRKAEEKRAQELERKRQEEELERQRKAEKEELVRKQQEAERERRAKEAAEEAARNARAAAEAAAEKLRQQQAELQKKRKAAEEHNRKLAAAQAAAEKEKTANKTFEIEEAWQAAPKPVLSTQTSNDGSGQAAKKSSASKVAPWSAAAAAAPPKEKSLKEIQEEEERQLRAEQAQQARLRKEQETVNLHASGTWSNASQRIQWNQAAQTAPAVVKPANAKPAWGGAGVEPQKTATSPFWDGPPLQAANKVAPAESAKKTANKGAAAKTEAKTIANEKAAKRALGMGEDNSVFLQWVVQRLKQLNSAVEADVLAVFIEGVENPDDVEDYVIGYLGDSKPVKEFVKEFLQKRCDFRNRKQHAVKDDLSSARGAPVSGNGAGFSAVQSKKKKNKGARLVVDGSCLGFRATSDPNRVNQGEIETVTLAPGQKR